MPKVTQQVSGRVGTPAPVRPDHPLRCRLSRGSPKGPPMRGCFLLLPPPACPAQGRKPEPGAGARGRSKEAAVTGGVPIIRGLGGAGGAARSGGAPGGCQGQQVACAGAPGGQSCGAGAGGRGPPAADGAPGSLPLGSRWSGCARAHLPAGGRGCEGAAPPSLQPPPGSPPGSPPGPRSVLRLRPTAARTARAQGGPGPQDVRKRAPGRRARTKPLSPLPRPSPPRSSPGPPPPPVQGRRGLGKVTLPLPPLRRFLEAAERARTCEVGHGSGEKPGTWSRGEGWRGGSERSRSWRMLLQLDGWKLDSQRDFPWGQGRGGGPGNWTIGTGCQKHESGGGKLFFGGRMRGKGPQPHPCWKP